MKEKTVQSTPEINKADYFAENYLLRALITQPEFIENNSINEELFNFRKTKDLFLSIQELKDSGSEINRANLIAKYIQKDVLEYSNIFIDQILSIDYETVSDVNSLVDQLKDCNKRRRVIKNLEKAISEIKNTGVLTEDITSKVKSLIDGAETELSGFSNNVNKVYSLPEWTDNYLESTQDRRTGRKYKFYNQIFDDLVTDGPTPGDFGIIAARSGSGKSTLVQNLANGLINMDIPVMYFSLEMGSITMMDRLLSMRTEIPYSEISYPKSPDDYDSIRQRIEIEKEELDSHTRFRFSECPTLTLSDIKKHIRKFQQDIGQTYCIVIIDLLSMVQDFTKVVNGQNSAFTMEQGVNKLSAMCKELGIHCVGVIQMNRGADEKINDLDDAKKLRPTINQLKNSKAFEERARWVIGTFRIKHYVEQFLKELKDEVEDVMEVYMMKQNSGLLSKRECMFTGEIFSISPPIVENREDNENDN